MNIDDSAIKSRLFARLIEYVLPNTIYIAQGSTLLIKLKRQINTKKKIGNKKNHLR